MALKPFTSDGCSGGMTWVWQFCTSTFPPWQSACLDHDHAYWQGGYRIGRKQADMTLYYAVWDNGYPTWALLMWIAVRLGGHPLLPLPWRWGYGHPWPRWYRKNVD